MSVRSNAYYGHTDLHPEFQDILRRNGLQAHVVDTGGILKLVVKGHDSPLLSYSISQQQDNTMTGWESDVQKGYWNAPLYGLYCSNLINNLHLYDQQGFTA